MLSFLGLLFWQAGNNLYFCTLKNLKDWNNEKNISTIEKKARK